VRAAGRGRHPHPPHWAWYWAGPIATGQVDSRKLAELVTAGTGKRTESWLCPLGPSRRAPSRFLATGTLASYLHKLDGAEDACGEAEGPRLWDQHQLLESCAPTRTGLSGRRDRRVVHALPGDVRTLLSELPAIVGEGSRQMLSFRPRPGPGDRENGGMDVGARALLR